jgi:quinol-cytochrome oxidoreductase complex cytochrome b subunit
MGSNEIKHSVVVKFLLHMHPKKVDENAVKYTRTFGLGGISALLFVVLATTGMMLRFSYVPVIDGAYDSIAGLQHYYVFGQLLRNIHYWSANLMVVVAFLHVIRVFYSQSIYFERRKNWLYGLVLLFIILAFNFTGYLLPWDQLSFWAVTIMTEILSYIPIVGTYLSNILRGGEQVGQSTLMNFYVLHTGLLPLLMIVFMILHFWLVRKAKGVTTSQPEKVKLVNVNPHLVRKEVIAALVVAALIMLLSVLFDAPLKDMANSLISPNPSKAPWYFMGLQEFLMHIHPSFVAFVLPVMVLGLLIYIPYQASEEVNVGVWFNSERGRKETINSAIFSFVLTLTLVLATEYILDFRGWFGSIPLIISTGLFPFLLYLIPAGGYLMYLWKSKKVDKPELLMSMVTIIIVSYLVMMIVGIWFRGESMKLIF